MWQSFERQVYLCESNIHALPLVVDAGNAGRCIGVLCLERRTGTEQETDHLLLELDSEVYRHCPFQCGGKAGHQISGYRGETAQDETRRASREDSLLRTYRIWFWTIAFHHQARDGLLSE